MQKENSVSLWVGDSDSQNVLEDYMEIRYTEDGDAIPSAFMRDFGISHYDEDFREAHYFENPSDSLSDLLEKHSYANEIIPQFIQKVGDTLPAAVNTIVLRYNFKYDEKVRATPSGSVRLTFYSAVKLE